MRIPKKVGPAYHFCTASDGATTDGPEEDLKLTRDGPALGVAAGALLLLIASTRYPGGTLESPRTVGYSWSRNFVSSLFQPRALNGAPNSARPLATVAWFIVCASLAVAFWHISKFRNALRQLSR